MFTQIYSQTIQFSFTLHRLLFFNQLTLSFLPFLAPSSTQSGLSSLTYFQSLYLHVIQIQTLLHSLFASSISFFQHIPLSERRRQWRAPPGHQLLAGPTYCDWYLSETIGYLNTCSMLQLCLISHNIYNFLNANLLTVMKFALPVFNRSLRVYFLIVIVDCCK